MATNNAINSSKPIGVASGGTGVATTTAYAVLCGGTTTTAPLQSIASVGSSGQVLTSNGAAALPTFQAASSGIATLNGNSGSATGSTVTITTGASNLNGTAAFSGASATLTLKFDDASGNLGLGNSGLGNGATLSGSDNTCIGTGTGRYISSANGNTFIGYTAGQGVTATKMTSGNNAGLGASALTALTTGSGDNTAIGSSSGSQLVTGAFNTLLGATTGFAYTTSESSNICIGYNTQGTAAESHVLRIGNGTGSSTAGNVNSCFISGITGIVVSGVAAQITSGNQLGVASSSKRFKNSIQDMKSASDEIYNLRPVTFDWDKNSAPGLEDAPDGPQPGLIAEEVYKVIPNLVVLDNDDEPLSVKYELLIPLMLNEIQILNRRIVVLENKNPQ